MIHSLLMSTTYGLPVNIFFLIAGSLAFDISTNRKWEMDHDSENNLDTSSILWERHDCPLIDCALLCERDPSCRSFFYHPSLANCLGSQSYKRGLPAGYAVQQGWAYYTKKQRCDGDYVYNQTPGLCYKLHRERQTFLDAMSACETEGAKLLIIRDVAEFQQIYDVTGNSDIWIGIRAMNANSEWKWWNGQAAPYATNQLDGPQLCVYISNRNVWNRNCTSTAAGFLCQRNI